MAGKLRQRDRPLNWVGSSKADYMDFPEAVKDDMGYALALAQAGEKHPQAKPWKGEGAGVYEIFDNHDGDTYRAIYAVRFEKAVYMLHAFQKKSPTGIKTAKHDVEVVNKRLKDAHKHYEENYGKASKAPSGRSSPRKR